MTQQELDKIVERHQHWLKEDCEGWEGMLAEKDAEIAELKQKLESVQASMYADVVDTNMENRRLKRALWLARAWRAKERQRMLPNNKEFYAWQNVERKCRTKAEEYR